MSENIGRVMEAASKINLVKNDTFKPMDPGEAKALAKDVAMDGGVLSENVGEFVGDKLQDQSNRERPAAEEIVLQQPTVKDVLNRMVEVSGDVSEKVEKRAAKALEAWTLCEEHADEVGANTPEQALVISEKVVEKHAQVEQQRQELATRIIDSMQREGSDGPTAKLIDLTVEAYVLDLPEDQRGGLDSKKVPTGVLKNDPRLQEYRDAIVRKVQSLAKDTETVVIDKKDIVGTAKRLWNGGLKNIWNRANIATKFAFNNDAKGELYAHMDASKELANLESEIDPIVGNLPSLEKSQVYLSHFGKFQHQAQLTINNQAVLDAMPIVSEGLVADQKDVINNLIIEAYEDNGFSLDTLNDAYNEQDERIAKARQDRLLLDKARKADAQFHKSQQEVGLRISAEMAKQKENNARAELSDLELQAIQLKETAIKHEELASKGLFALVTLQESEASIAEFNKMIADGKLPDALQDILSSDMGVELEEFITTKGKKGSVEAVRKLIGSAQTMGQLEKVVFDVNNPDGFLGMNVLKDVANPNKIVETGVAVEPAEDGTWQFRFATKENGKVTINQEIPVVNLKPEKIFASLTSIDATESALQQARLDLSLYQRQSESADLIIAVPAADKKKYRNMVSVSKLRVDELQNALKVSKATLAEELRTSNTSKTLGSAFGEMVKAQSEVAKDFYSAGFREMVGDLATELKIAPDKVTAEVLATLVVEASHASEQANQLAEYFDAVKTPGAIEAKVVDGRIDEIDALAAKFATLQKQESIVAMLDPGSAKDKAAKDHAKARRALEKEGEAFGEIINQDFVDAIPAPLRKGVGAVNMTSTQFKNQVKDTLDMVGLDSSKFLKRNGAVVERVRTTLPYASEVKALVHTSAKALVDIEGTEALLTLRTALAGGDVKAFLDQAQEIRARLTKEKFTANQAEADRAKLAELLRTPDGMAQQIYNNEINWDEALPLIDAGEMDPQALEASILNLEAGELRDKAVKEAARRMQSNVMAFVKEAGFAPVEEGSEDPLNGNPTIAAEARFAAKYASADAKALLESFANRLSAEKKRQ